MSLYVHEFQVERTNRPDNPLALVDRIRSISPRGYNGRTNVAWYRHSTEGLWREDPILALWIFGHHRESKLLKPDDQIEAPDDLVQLLSFQLRLFPIDPNITLYAGVTFATSKHVVLALGDLINEAEQSEYGRRVAETFGTGGVILDTLVAFPMRAYE